jgi:Zn-dependent metalloprotease
VQQAKTVLKKYLLFSQYDEMRPFKTESDPTGYTHTKYQQYYRGVPVEGGVYTVHSKNSAITSMSGGFYRLNLQVQPSVSEREALQAARQSIGARVYKWELATEEQGLKREKNDPKATYYPKGSLVIFPDGKQAGQLVHLAYKFNIYAHQPLSREYVYVDAQTGKVIYKDAIIKHIDATGTAATRYSGTRTVTTDQPTPNGTFRLRGIGGRGQGIETYNMQNCNQYGSAVDFTDGNNNWTEYNNGTFDNAALDAHWGAQATYDYFRNVHQRNSYDNAGATIRSYVHFNDTCNKAQGYSNAFWDGLRITYGDGNSNPLNSLDIVAHEYGHAVTEKTANLRYQGESGALNEGFSDIWGACVENFATTGKSTWLLGEDVLGGQGLRSMSNPNSKGHPDTYQGSNWVNPDCDSPEDNDNCGVHTNSSVLNHWFYLLSVGGSGTNDKGNSYKVFSISIQKAARIAYRALSHYLSSESKFADARTATIQAAMDLYGASSNEVIQTTNAWYAVGVGEAHPTPVIVSFSPTSGEVGTEVIIKGHGFVQSVQSVRFNNTQAAYIQVNSTKIQAFVQPNSTTGPVRLTTQNGSTSATAFSSTSFVVKLSSPKKFTINQIQKNQIGMQWLDGSDETAYVIERSLNKYDSYFSVIATLPANQTTYFNSGLAENTTYYYRIKAIKGGESSAYAGPVNATTLSDKPAAPTNFMATSLSDTQLKLTWKDNATDETKYILKLVDYSTYDIVVHLATLGANATSYTHTDLIKGKKYEYQLYAENSGGHSDLAVTSAVAGTPAAPSHLAASTAWLRVSLTWKDNATNETGNTVERAVLGGHPGVPAGVFNQIANLDVNKTYYQDQSVLPGAVYLYRIRTYNQSGSNYSDQLMVVASTSPPPPAPTNLQVKVTSPTNVTLTWKDNATTETGFVLERAIALAPTFPGPTYHSIATLGTNVTSYQDTGVQPNTYYIYRVRAAHPTSGNSPYTYSATVKTTLEINARVPAEKETFGDELSPSVYPNPFRNHLTIEGLGHSGDEVEWNLYDLNGRLLKHGRQQAKGRIKLDMSLLGTGTYLLRVRASQQISSFRLVKN